MHALKHITRWLAAFAQAPAKKPNIPVGEALWLQELESYGPYPALQSPASYSLAQVLQQVKDQMAKSRGNRD